MRLIDNPKIKLAFEEYDRMSNKVLDYVVMSIEAEINGNAGLITYIEEEILPKLRRKSYQLFRHFQEETEKFYGKNRVGTTKKIQQN